MIRLEHPNKKQLELISELYHEAFPASERKPFALIKRFMHRGLMDVLAISGDRFLGLAILFRHEHLVLLDYFAIMPDERSQGIGGEVLELIRKRYPDNRIVLEIEDGEDEEMLRRRQFYLRNGFTETGIRITLFGVPMALLIDGGELRYLQYRRLMKKLLGPLAIRTVLQRR